MYDLLYCYLKLVYLCCCRLLEVAGVKKEDAPLTWTLSREVNAVFDEVDENDIMNEYGADYIQPPISENTVDALKHNPYVDSDLPSLDTTLMQHAQSWDVVKEVAVKQNIGQCGESQLDVGELKSTNIANHARRASDSSVLHACEIAGLSDYHPVFPLARNVNLEPLNLSGRKTNKKGGKGKKANDNNTAASGTAEMNSFFNSLKQNVTKLGTNDRIQVAKCLASSACADSSVHNRVEKIKVSSHMLTHSRHFLSL